MALYCSKNTISIKWNNIKKWWFNWLNWCHSVRTKNKLKPNKTYVKINIFVALWCLLKILSYQYQKPDKTPFIIYADLNLWKKKWMDVKKNSEKSRTTKVGEHIPLGFSISAILSFKDTEIRMMYKEVKLALKILWILKKSCKEDNWF